MMKKFETLRELPKRDTDMKWANVVEKTVFMDLLNVELPETFNL